MRPRSVTLADLMSGVPFELNHYSPQAAGLVACFPSLLGPVPRELVAGATVTSSGTVTWMPDARLGRVYNYATSAYHLVADSPRWDVGYITVAFWFNVAAIGVDQDLVCRVVSGTGNSSWAMRLSATNRLSATIWDTTNAYIFVQPLINLAANIWRHVAFTFDGLTLSLYVDGKFNTSTAYGAPTTLRTNASIITFNTSNIGYATAKSLAHIGIWNYALPPSTIWQMAQPDTMWDLIRPLRRFYVVNLPGVTITAVPATATGAGVAGSVGLTVISLPLFDKLLGDALFHGHSEESHATQHRAGGTDPLKLDDLAAADDTTDLNATTSAHGLLPKGDNDATHFLNGDVEWAALNEYSIAKVATVTAVDMKTAGKTTLYTVPTGKTFFPMFVLVRGLSASLAGGTDYDFGFGASADTWWQEVNMANMTTPTTDFMQIGECGASSWNTSGVAGDEFGIKVNTGSTAAATATLDVFGLLV